jgi:hypothetical protein
MTDWTAVKQVISPVKDYEDLCVRFKRCFSFDFIQQAYTLTMPELMTYTRRLLGGDTRQRYTDYTTRLTGIQGRLDQAGVRNTHDLTESTQSRDKMEDFVRASGIPALEIALVLKYLIYWFIPMEKYLSGLVGSQPVMNNVLLSLRQSGVRTNLEILQQALTSADRKTLADKVGLPETVITELVHRADLSRLPWTSKATISNIIGSGYGSLARLAGAERESLYTDYMSYGKAIGKNLKLGNEIESSHRIAQIIPPIVR